MVEIFKTNVSDKSTAEIILKDLSQLFPYCKFNFDLDDCDRILRVDYSGICPKNISDVLLVKGFSCITIE